MAVKRELRHLNMHYKPRHFTSVGEWELYAKWLRRHARVSLGLLPASPRPSLRPRVFGRWEGEGFTCEKVYLETLPGFYSTGNLFRPAGASRKRGRQPAVLCPHGHWADGRLHDRDPLGSIIARCIQLARMGATVFSWDMVGLTDSCQVPHRIFAVDEHWGLSLMGLQAWHSTCALEWLLSMKEVDPKRIGITGCSGGGTQTFTMMAAEERLAAAAPICMISYSMQGGCLCENAPLIRIDATSVDLARLFAPKPAFMGSCTGDWTKNTPREEFPAVRDIYRLYGKTGDLYNVHVKEQHNYNLELREAVYGFFNRYLFGAKSAKPVKEEWAVRPPHADRMVWWGREAPEKISPKEMRSIWIERQKKALKPLLKSPSAARKALGPLLPHCFGVTLSSVDEFRRRRPEGVNVVEEAGALIVSPGPKAPDRTGEVQFFSAYNRMPFGDRVHEVLAAVENSDGRAKLVGKGEAGLWCLVAGALSPKVRALDVELRGFDPKADSSWKRRFDVPAIRQVGGLATVFAMIGKRPLELRHASAAARKLAKKYAR